MIRKAAQPIATLEAIDDILASDPSSQKLWSSLMGSNVVEISNFILRLRLSADQKTRLMFIVGVMVLAFRKSGKRVRKIEQDVFDRLQAQFMDERSVHVQEDILQNLEPHIWATFQGMMDETLDPDDWGGEELADFRVGFDMCLAAMIGATYAEKQHQVPRGIIRLQ